VELKENATFLGFVRVSDLDGMFVGMGAEGFDGTCSVPEPYVFNFSRLSTHFSQLV